MGMSTNFYVGPIAIRIGMAPCRSSIPSTSSELIFCFQSERILVSFWLLVSSLSPTCLFATSKRRSLADRGCLGKVSQWVSLGIGLCIPVVNVSVQMFTLSFALRSAERRDPLKLWSACLSLAVNSNPSWAASRHASLSIAVLLSSTLACRSCLKTLCPLLETPQFSDSRQKRKSSTIA